MRFFGKDECGATLVEYGVALIVAIVLGGSGLAALAGQSETSMIDAETSLAYRG